MCTGTQVRILMPLRFSGDQVVHYVENGVQTVAFAERETADPSRYLIHQRAIPYGDDTYYYEIGSRQISGDGGLEFFEVSASVITIKPSDSLREFAGISFIEISLRNNNGDDFALIQGPASPAREGRKTF